MGNLDISVLEFQELYLFRLSLIPRRPPPVKLGALMGLRLALLISLML